MKIVVIVPTYQEKENIGLLITELQKEFRKIPHDCHILVVDDSSPDGTAEEVKKVIEQSSNRENSIHLLTGRKQGLGAAYIRGIKFALANLHADLIVEMDADFSHKPKDVPRILEEIDKGADFVIGSRYVRGGKIPDNWNFIRVANSRWGNRFARYIVGIDNVKDCTAGFRAIKADLLKKIDLDSLKVRGYSFQMNLLYRAYMQGAKIKEVPVEFVEREKGHTKLGPADILEFMGSSLILRWQRGVIMQKPKVKKL
ncbi:MAG: polyprenol monophosphomannose synthase [Candidatus Woykebacteria bacterium]